MCGKPKCVEARRRAAALKAGRGVPPVDTAQAQPAPDNQPAPAAAQTTGGVIVSTNNPKGIVQ